MVQVKVKASSQLVITTFDLVGVILTINPDDQDLMFQLDMPDS